MLVEERSEYGGTTRQGSRPIKNLNKSTYIDEENCIPEFAVDIADNRVFNVCLMITVIMFTNVLSLC